MASRRTILRGAMAAGLAGTLGSLTIGQPALADDAPVPTLLSLNKAVTASSIQNASTPASAAVDGSLSTRWSSQFADPQWIQVDLGRRYTVTQVILRWETAYASEYEVQISVDGVHWTTPFYTRNGGGGVEMVIGGDTPARYVRLICMTRATQYGYSLWEIQIYGIPYVVEPPGSLAQGKLATASSIEGPSFPASAAFDGKLDTRWSSQFSDAQWLQVDLGQLYTVTGYKLIWETAYAIEYGIFTSADAVNWDEQFYTTEGYGGDVVCGSSGYPPLRYVQLRAAKRGTRYGYSLWELAVYGG
jgi:hypothetical protein